MLARRVIPCLDVTDGRVVKGTRFLDLRDAGDPVELAAFYDRAGADELVFLDITASSDARAILIDVVKATADQVFIPLTVGGGVRTVEDMSMLLESGADKTAVNTAALDRPALISDGARLLGAQCVVLAIDAKQREGAGGWTSTAMAAARTPAATRSSGPGRAWSGAPARYCSPAWIAMAPGTAMTSSSPANSPKRCRCR